MKSPGAGAAHFPHHKPNKDERKKKHMTDAKLKSLIAEAVDLDRVINENTKRLNELKKQIIAESRTRSDEHVPTDGGGRSWLGESSDDCIARVTFPADSLKSSINPDSKEGSKVLVKAREFCGKHFDRLFTAQNIYKPVDNFRTIARDVLGDRTGSRLINLCESDTQTRVSFETKEAVKAAA